MHGSGYHRGEEHGAPCPTHSTVSLTGIVRANERLNRSGDIQCHLFVLLSPTLCRSLFPRSQQQYSVCHCVQISVLSTSSCLFIRPVYQPDLLPVSISITIKDKSRCGKTPLHHALTLLSLSETYCVHGGWAVFASIRTDRIAVNNKISPNPISDSCRRIRRSLVMHAIVTAAGVAARKR